MSNDPQPDWYLRQWLAHYGKRQADMVRELGWDKARVSFVVNGRQSYRRDTINEIARWLKVEPYELLMPPATALKVRNFKDAALAMVAEDPPPAFEHQPKKSTKVA